MHFLRKKRHQGPMQVKWLLAMVIQASCKDLKEMRGFTALCAVFTRSGRQKTPSG